ncbi:MAG: 2-phospho-L-lactate transferase [Methanocellales archaeon]
MLLLSGGTGTPKLLRGLKEIVPQEQITVIVNTAEDLWVSGNLVCPDIDTVIYTLADLIDDSKWWGIKGDTFHTHSKLKALGFKEAMMIGDADRATHILRTEFIRRGESLTSATMKLCEHYNVKAKVLPMSDEKVETYIHTKEMGELHFQHFWITHGGKLEVEKVELRGIEKAKPSKEVIKALEREEAVVIGPSNPVTSIGPIINLRDVREILRNKFVIAISPFIGKQVISGPAAKFLCALNYDASSLGVAKYYEDFLDVFIVHEGDDLNVEGIKIVRADILMVDKAKSMALARLVKKLSEDYLRERKIAKEEKIR